MYAKLIEFLSDEVTLRNRQLIVTFENGDFIVTLRQNKCEVKDLSFLCNGAAKLGYIIEYHQTVVSDAIYYDLVFFIANSVS